ncbi:MAG: nitroreductase [Candidatus Aminicenantes bacterium RBG_13_63_10]|nr:MAG: nitroreductase [Candidatus Aminicenantes bacterium RBG_13_63_10]
MANLSDLISSRRSIRQFARRPVDRGILRKMAGAARLAPSAANLQPLEFVAVDDEAKCRTVFKLLKWAAYIAPAGNPQPGNEPAAYIVVLVNTSVREKMYEYDVGAAQMSMILSAWEEGVASCWVISVDKPELARLLGVEPPYVVDSVLALGYPVEKSVAEDFGDSPKYWKDEVGLFHVPKRRLERVLHFNAFGER